MVGGGAERGGAPGEPEMAGEGSGGEVAVMVTASAGEEEWTKES